MSDAVTAPPLPDTATVHRFEVWVVDPANDAAGRSVADKGRRLGLDVPAPRSAQVYLIEGELTEDQLNTIGCELLTDPVTQRFNPDAAEINAGERSLEIFPKPGVMDPAAQSVELAVKRLIGVATRVTTGRRFVFEGADDTVIDQLARRALANPVVHAIYTEPFRPEHLAQAHAGGDVEVRRVTLAGLGDGQLETLSRDAHLFLSLDEMRTIRDTFAGLARDPTEIELETLAQTWSEHCVHKTLKSRVRYRPSARFCADVPPPAGFLVPGLDMPNDARGSARPGHEFSGDGVVTIDNLLRSSVAAATHELIAEGLDWTMSVFVDNAGIIRFDDERAVCVKVETHNHPSAIEPYGGAATGLGGCIRDIIGAGLAAEPIASTDVFCVADPRMAPEDVPPGVIHPARVLSEVVAGVRDYGNRMGIPTVSGAVHTDDRYIGNPLVFCGCVGSIPNGLISGEPSPGDLIVALGGRTGRDGVHGATFSSAELTDTHADEFAHAVQIGNPIEEKKLLDAIMRARDIEGGPLFSAITDCGAGGFSSAVGEMGEHVGARVMLERAPLKYAGLTYTEIWISEAQERMVLAVPEGKLDDLQRICDEESVELAVLGEFGTPERTLELTYQGVEVGSLPMALLHDGIPQPTREASWTPNAAPALVSTPAPSTSDALLALLSDPNIASKRAIIRQYDHEVQGRTIVKPLVGPEGEGPGNASVITPTPGADRGLAIAVGLATGFGSPDQGGDPYLMALAAIDECVRNLVCVGADPSTIAILDNFCWPSCAKPQNLGALVRACAGCYDAAKAFGTPFISGKDSLNNQFTTADGRTIEIPPTLLISGVGRVEPLGRCVTSDASDSPDRVILLVGPDQAPDAVAMGGSLYQRLFGLREGADRTIPRVRLEQAPKTARAVASLIRDGLVHSAHDPSEGGVLVALAEMLIGAYDEQAESPGALINPGVLGIEDHATCFGECPSRYLLEVDAADADACGQRLKAAGASWRLLAGKSPKPVLGVGNGDWSVPVRELRDAWTTGLSV